MTTLQKLTNVTSRLPLPNKENKMVTRGGMTRRVLGDITGQETNTRSQATLGNKARVTRQASRRVLSAPVPVPEEAMDVEQEDQERVFPSGVDDIDQRDLENPQLCAEYALEMFAYLRQLEVRGAVRAGHLTGCPTNDKMRAVLVDWLVEVQLQFKLLQETLFSTVEIIDRYLAVEGSQISRSRLQLVGVSAMFLAAKIEEVYAPACSDFVYITDNAYSEAEIRQTELKILNALKFELFQPVSLHFLRRFSKAGDVDVLQHSLAKYALEVCLLDYTLVPTNGSELAAAALFLSLLVLEPGANIDSVWSPTLQFYSGYTKAQLVPIVAKLAAGIVKISCRSSKLQSVRTKYKGGKFLKVADLPELKGEVMTRVAAMK